jgi:hypothetical protein
MRNNSPVVRMGENHMSKKAAEHHKQASEHPTHAARHHWEAAKHHEAGSHEKAAHHAQVARGHVIHVEPIAMPEREHQPDYARHPVPKELDVPAVY